MFELCTLNIEQNFQTKSASLCFFRLPVTTTNGNMSVQTLMQVHPAVRELSRLNQSLTHRQTDAGIPGANAGQSDNNTALIHI